MRNSILMSAFGVSMEGADPTENVEINPVTEQTTVAVDEALDEMREAEDVAEEHEEAVEELSEVAESLESLIVSLESAIDAGGMSEQTADLHGRAMAIATRRLPIDASDYTVSTESFGRDGDKMTASMEALEKTKEMLSKIWNAIKTAIVKAFEAAKNFVQTLGKSAGALKRAGALLQAQAGTISKEKSDAKIDITSLASYLGSATGSMEGNASDSLGKIVVSGKKVAERTVSYSDAIKQKAGNVVSGEGGIALPTTAWPGSFPGGRTIVLDENRIPTFKSGEKGDVKKIEVAAWSKDEIVKVGKAIVSIGDMIGEYDRKHFKKISADMAEAIKKADGAIKKADGEKTDTAESRKRLAEFRKVATAVRTVGPQFMSYAASAAKASFGTGKKAIAAHKSTKGDK